MKLSERLSTLFFPDENQTTIGQQAFGNAQRSAMNRMTFNDSMWHCNLPIEKKIQPKRYYKFPVKCLKIRISMVHAYHLNLAANSF